MNALRELVVIEQEQNDDKLQDVKARLANWVRYRAWRDGGRVGPADTVCLLGRLYVAPKDESRRNARAIEPNTLDGFLVDKCVCALPDQNRDAIMIAYLGWVWINGRRVSVSSLNERHRILAVSRATYYRLMERSLIMLKNNLTRETNRRKNRINSATL